MLLDQFIESIEADVDPPGLALALRALWWDRKGDWDAAHGFAQQDKGAAGAWVHAYLHRVEGDLSNAGYWYRRAGKPPFSGSFDTEWREIADTLLRDEQP